MRLKCDPAFSRPGMERRNDPEFRELLFRHSIFIDNLFLRGDSMKESISIMIPESEIEKRTREIGEAISRDYAGKTVHMICVLKGGVYFMTALSKRISEDVPVTLDFMSVSSYGDDTKSSGVVKIVKDLDEPLEGKDVLIVEDIIDSGRTLYYLLDIIRGRKPASVRLCTLLDKPQRRERDVHVDYTGFNIEDRFVIGCGMDYKQKYRNLPYIGEVILSEEEQ